VRFDFSEEAFEFADFVRNVHVKFLVEGEKFTAKYDSARERFLMLSTDIAQTDFILETQRFLASLNDGHLSRTFLQRVQNDTILFQDGLFTAQKFIARDDKLFLTDEKEHITNREVVSIAGVPVDSIFSFIDQYYVAYNHTCVLRSRGWYAGYELILRRTGGRIGYDNDKGIFVELVYRINGQDYDSILELVDQPHIESKRLPNYEPEYFMRYEMIGDVMYINMPAVLTENAQLDETEAAIKTAIDNGTRKFILDLRYTPGGHTHVGDRLLRAMGLTPPGFGTYLRMSDYNRIPGRIRGHLRLRYFSHLTYEHFMENELIYVPRNIETASNPYNVTVAALTSPFTFSGATILAVEVADGGFGPIIGEPSATAPSGCGYGSQYWGKHTGVQIRPHIMYYLRPDANADQKTLWPDIPVNSWEALEVALEYMKTITTNSEQQK
jgi:hypothetical protein